MSDCHNWLGSARSKRRGPCCRAWVAAGAGPMSPSSCRMRRTSASLTPMPSPRASSSRIRRVPCSGCSRLAAWIALRCGVSGRGDPALSPKWQGVGFSPSRPRCCQRTTQLLNVPDATPTARATCASSPPRSTTALTAFTRNSSGYGCPPFR
jgi:hypothetical protein